MIDGKSRECSTPPARKDNTYHVDREGEYLAGIAREYGITDCKTIHNHPKSAEFKTRRPDPNVLCCVFR